MKIQSINNANSFQGRIQANLLLDKYKEELSPVQKKIFERQIQRIEGVKDGRVFKFDRFVNPYETGGAEVGIFERKALINDTYWIPLFCSKRNDASSCFEKLHKLYMNI